MTGPRISAVHPHRRRGRHLLPFLATIILGPLACSEQPTMPESSSTGVSAKKGHLHPYVMIKDGPPVAMSLTQSAKSAALVTLGSGGSGSKILLLADANGASTTALASNIADAGFLVTVRPAPEHTWDGTDPSVDGFDLIIHLNGHIFDNQLSPLSPDAQSALEAFVQGGGGFVGSQWNGLEAIEQQTGMNDLVLLGFGGEEQENCASCPMTYTAVPAQQSHPVLAGVPASFTFQADGHVGGPLVPSLNSTVLMELPSAAPGVAVRTFGNGKVVNFSFAPNYGLGGEGQTLRNVDIQRLYLNAVRWAARATKAPATITLVDPVPTFDGTAKGASIVTDPAGLTGLSVSYSQAGVSVPEPVDAGVYEVLVTLDHADFEAPQATGTLTILRATPVIHWTPPTITAGTPLTGAELNASAAGVGGIGLVGDFVYVPAEGTVLEAGTRPLSVEFLPVDGNYTSAIKTVTVVVSQPAGGLTFKGFYPPVRNLPVQNRVKAGHAVPVKFSISGKRSGKHGGKRGLDALAGSPTSRSVSCVAGAPEKTVKGTLEARHSRLDYSRHSGVYRYLWKTSSSWAGSCRMLQVKLVDGTTHEALFHFPKKQRSRHHGRRDHDRDRRDHDDRDHYDRDDRDDDRGRGGHRKRDKDD